MAEWKGLEYQKRIKVLDRDNVGLVIRFQLWEKKPSQNPAMFCVAVTHLLFNSKAGDVKLAQLALLLAELDCITQQGRLPCVLCGDMNSVPPSPLVKFIETGTLNYSQLSAVQVSGYHKEWSSRPIPIPLLPPAMAIGQDCHYRPVSKYTGGGDGGGGTTPPQREGGSPVPVLSHSFTFSSAYPHPSPSTPPSTVTTYHSSGFETVDYIYFTSSSTHPLSSSSTHPASSSSTHPPSSSSTHSPSQPVSGTTSPQTRGRGRGGGRAGFRLLGRRDLISAERLLQLGPQPHHLLPSDHLWLLASLQLIPA